MPPSLTSRMISYEPTGRVLVEITLSAKKLVSPFSNQKYCKGSLSTSEERDASNVIVALVPFGEITKVSLPHLPSQVKQQLRALFDAQRPV